MNGTWVHYPQHKMHTHFRIAGAMPYWQVARPLTADRCLIFFSLARVRRTLLEWGADVFAEDNDSETPLDLAWSVALQAENDNDGSMEVRRRAAGTGLRAESRNLYPCKQYPWRQCVCTV